MPEVVRALLAVNALVHACSVYQVLLVFVSLGASWSFRCHLLGKPAVSAIVARGSSVGQGDGREGVGVVARRCMARGDSSALWQLG